jgi:hypothetical protein
MPNLLQKYSRQAPFSRQIGRSDWKKALTLTELTDPPKARILRKRPKTRTFGHGTRLGLQPGAEILHSAQ